MRGRGGKEKLGRQVRIQIGQRFAHPFVLADDGVCRIAQRAGVFAIAGFLGEAARGGSQRGQAQSTGGAGDVLRHARGVFPVVAFARAGQPRAKLLGGLHIGLQDFQERGQAERFLQRGERGRIDGGDGFLFAFVHRAGFRGASEQIAQRAVKGARARRPAQHAAGRGRRARAAGQQRQQRGVHAGGGGDGIRDGR